jgi:CheY-specific phosphatase CheX
MSDDTIIELAKRALNKSELAKDEMIAFFGEFGNIVGGNACSMLNTFNRGLSLRVSPPTIFHGKDLTISIGEIKSTSLVLQSNAGEIFMNIGFQRGDDEWM